jgi:uncharacterized hydrophobic protein (TIGR00271 family)
MSVIGFVPDPESAATVVSWTQALSGAEATVEFLCWDRWGESATWDAVRAALGDVEAKVTAVEDTDVVSAVARHCREVQARLLITSVFEIADWPDQDSDNLLNAAPCRTVVGRYGERGAQDVRKALVIASGGPHARTLLDLVRHPGRQVTVAAIEHDIGEQSEEVGRRALEQTLRDADLESADHIERNVVVDNNPISGILRAAEGHDLVLVGLDQRDFLLPLHLALGGAAAAVVKREPPLRRRALADWVPRINPADYVDLVQDLRAGSRWGANFVVMLAMASAIATLGLLQDSPAVVIGAMLVAPLMTPMIGFGLSIVQANPRLAAVAGRTIGQGILLTLAISYLMGLVIPGGELLSRETLARGTPNILDLGIALFAAVAAAFALARPGISGARPGISGAIAGVAIATALVPPLCSVGVSLAYSHWLNALGAATLFGTNLVAIVLSSALTFFLMGVTPARALARYRRFARWVAVTLVTMLLVFSIPLGSSLSARITGGSVRPLGYPVKRTVARAIQGRVAQETGVELMFMARSSISNAVVIYVASQLDVSRQLANDLTRIVRDEMEADELDVHVFAVRLAWKS